MVLSRLTTGFIEAHPADAARVLEDASSEVVGEVLTALPAPSAAAVLRAMTPHAAAGALADLPPAAAAAVVKSLPIELAAALLLRLDADVRAALMKELPRTASVPLRMVLRFPAGSVGSLIDPHVVTVPADARVGKAIEIARRAPASLRKYLYVLDEALRLTGTVDARQCLLQEPTLPIGRFVQGPPVALRARASLREASRNPAWERFSVMPAVDHRGVFLGVVRRTALRRVMARRSLEEPEVAWTDLAIDLADLCWQTTAGLLIGAPKEVDRE